jgi:hypothetical protein
MKKIMLFAIAFTFMAIGAAAQPKLTDTTRVLVENEKIKVTEYVSTPGNDVCGGPGLHSHPAHLSILLTDATVRLTSADGKKQDFTLKAGTAFWSEAESHIVVNSGDKPVRAYLVEYKHTH